MLMKIIMMSIAMALLGAAKKGSKPVFGQLTLTGEKAVDWVKHETKVTASKIWIGSAGLLSDFNLPDWAIEKGIVGLIFPTSEWGNPLLVSQKSILKVLEAKCCDWEAAGASVENVKIKGGLMAQITFEEDAPTMEFLRPADAKQFDPYKVVFD